jgi:hypothetical protein
MSETPAVDGRDEAAARARLLLAERALEAGETDEAENALRLARAERFPAIVAWSRKVAARLASVRGAAPLVTANPKRLGTLSKPPTVPVGRVADGEEDPEVGLFWLKGSLCVRQEGAQRGSMRCYDAVAGKWGGVTPYVSPFATGPKLVAAYLGHPGGYATKVLAVDAGGEREIGDFGSPSLIARDSRGGLVVREGEGGGSVTPAGYDPARGVGSLLAGGGRYFFDGPSSLRSIAQPGRNWTMSVPGSGTGVACVGEPLSSPDERRAACLASRDPAGKGSAPYELWIFELAEPPARK